MRSSPLTGCLTCVLQDCEVVFLGDSITQGWLGEGLPVWNESYAKLGAVNLGIGGDEVQHVLILYRKTMN